MLINLPSKNVRKQKLTLGNKLLPRGHFELLVNPETNGARVFFKGQINMDSKNTNTGLVAFNADEKPAWWIKRRRNLQMKPNVFLRWTMLSAQQHMPVFWCCYFWTQLPFSPGTDSPLQESLFPPVQLSVFSFHGSWFPSRGLHQTPHTNSFRAWPLWLFLQGETWAKENNKCLNSVPLIRSQSMIITNLINPNKLIPLILTLCTWKVRHRQFKLFPQIHAVCQGQE